MKTNTNTKRRSPARVRIFTEFFNNYPGITNAACYADLSQENARAAEICNCPNPYKCFCRPYNSPQPDHKNRMDRRLFKSPTPYLLYTITRGADSGSQFIFSCKSEKEVKEETFRLNSLNKHVKVWNYKEESKYNEKEKADHRDFLIQQNEYDKFI